MRHNFRFERSTIRQGVEEVYKVVEDKKEEEGGAVSLKHSFRNGKKKH